MNHDRPQSPAYSKAVKPDLPGKRDRIIAIGRGALYGTFGLFLILLIWFLSQLDSPTAQPSGTVEREIWLFGIFVLLVPWLYGLLVKTLHMGVKFIAINQQWAYRVVFLIGVTLALFYWSAYGLLPWIGDGQFHILYPNLLGGLFTLLISFLGVLCGALSLTGLVENNEPPAEVIEEVLRIHLVQIGEVYPALPVSKRVFDICLAILGLVLSIPVWLISACLVWFEDPGPILFIKNSVGKGGVNFHLLKFRTMVRETQHDATLVVMPRNDQITYKEVRTLFVGRFLRKTALDELPQLLNILRGEMSFVGPRPHRTVYVHTILKELPQFVERHRVLPGIAGLAQVTGDYAMTPLQKLRLDRIYIRNQSLGLDTKLMCVAFLIAFWYRWQAGWDGRPPSWLLRLGGSRNFTRG